MLEQFMKYSVDSTDNLYKKMDSFLVVSNNNANELSKYIQVIGFKHGIISDYTVIENKEYTTISEDLLPFKLVTGDMSRPIMISMNNKEVFNRTYNEFGAEFNSYIE